MLKLDLVLAVWRWTPPRGVLHSVHTSFDGRSLSVALWVPGSPIPPFAVPVLCTESPGSTIDRLDQMAAAYLTGDVAAVPRSSVFRRQLDAAAAAFEAAVADTHLVPGGTHEPR